MNKKIFVPILCALLVVGVLSGCEEEEPANEGPTASFTAPDPIYINQEVTFTDTSTDDTAVTSWSWDLNGDDVEDSTEQNPTYTYTEIGDYDVTLTVSDADGETDDTTSTVTVSYMPPTAAFDYSPMVNITVNETTVEFTDNSTAGDANITSWLWDFGDGTNSTEQNTSHMYNATGNYTVTLTVTDENELTDTAEVTIEVIEAS